MFWSADYPRNPSVADNVPRATLSNAPPLGSLSRMLHTNVLLYRQGEQLFGGNGERV